MATKTQFEPLVRGVVDAFGGPDNIHSVTHCATRLRFVVKDAVKADIKKAEAVDGVITAIKSGGQHQVVVGNDVPLAYQELMTIPGMAPKGLLNRDSSAEQAEAAGNGEKKNLLDRFIDMISAIITPLICSRRHRPGQGVSHPCTQLRVVGCGINHRCHSQRHL